MTDKKPQSPVPMQLRVNASEVVRNGVYANLVSITITSNKEIIIDFVFSHPMDKNDKNEQVGNLVSRVILPLNVAKDMKLILDTQLGKTKSE